jgi:hypothetical protein
MSFDSSTFKTSFLVGDIISGNLQERDPLPDLSFEESEQLHDQLIKKISKLRVTDERLLAMYANIKAQTLSQHLDLPDMDPPLIRPKLAALSIPVGPKEILSSNQDEFDSEVPYNTKFRSLKEELSAVTSTTSSKLGEEDLPTVNDTTESDLDDQVFHDFQDSAPTHATVTERAQTVEAYTAKAYFISAILASVFGLAIFGILVGMPVQD